MKTLCVLLASGFCTLAQNVVVLTHGSANSEEFQRGCPAGYPRSWKDIGSANKLPEGFSPAWVIMTKTELDARFAQLDSAKEAWNKQQEDAPRIAAEQAKSAEAAAKAAKKVETDSVITEVEIGFKEWQTADEKAKGDVLLKLLHLILDALRSLGSDVKQIEKPTAEIAAPK